MTGLHKNDKMKHKFDVIGYFQNILAIPMFFEIDWVFNSKPMFRRKLR